MTEDEGMAMAVNWRRETFSPYAKVLWPFVAILDAAMVWKIVFHGHAWQAVASMLVATLGNLAMGYGVAWVRNQAYERLGLPAR